MYTGIRLWLLICPFISSFFFLSNYQTNIFVTFFSGTMRSRRLKFGTQIVGRCIVCTRIGLLLLICSFIHFSFSPIFEHQNFSSHFSRTVRPRRLKLGTYVDSRQMYRVYRNQAAAAYSSLYFFIFFLSNFQTLKFFVILL